MELRSGRGNTREFCMATIEDFFAIWEAQHLSMVAPKTGIVSLRAIDIYSFETYVSQTRTCSSCLKPEYNCPEPEHMFFF